MNTNIQQTTLDTLSQALHRHDWHYNSSDDYRVWRRGVDEVDAIRDMIESLDKAGLGKEARALYNKVAEENLK